MRFKDIRSLSDIIYKLDDIYVSKLDFNTSNGFLMALMTFMFFVSVATCLILTPYAIYVGITPLVLVFYSGIFLFLMGIVYIGHLFEKYQRDHKH